MCDEGQDDEMLGQMDGRDARRIETVVGGGEAADIQDNELRQREADIRG